MYSKWCYLFYKITAQVRDSPFLPEVVGEQDCLVCAVQAFDADRGVASADGIELSMTKYFDSVKKWDGSTRKQEGCHLGL